MPETRKTAKQRDAVAESPKFVHEFVKDRNMGLLLRSHVGRVTKSEFDFDSKSRSNQLVWITNIHEDDRVRA